jgi:large subunit ribosomal protein L20
MARVKRGVASHRRRKLTLRQTKGYRWGGKTKYRLAKERLLKAWQYSFRDRKAKKRAYRRLWQVQISSILKEKGLSWSVFSHLLKTQNIQLDRKILATLVQKEPGVFAKIIEMVRK